MYRLRSGEKAIVRMPQITEAQAVLDLKRSYLKNTSTLPLTLEEYPDDLEKESSLINEVSFSKSTGYSSNVKGKVEVFLK